MKRFFMVLSILSTILVIAIACGVTIIGTIVIGFDANWYLGAFFILTWTMIVANVVYGILNQINKNE